MSRDEIIKTALDEVGVKEDPAGSNKVKYNTWFYNKEVSGKVYPWCGVFVSWVFDMAGLSLGKIDYLRGFAGTNYAVNNLKKWGRLVGSPLPGDVVFFDWDGNGRWDHTGIFYKDQGGGFFQSIEGNTDFGNDSNGGRVMIRERAYSHKGRLVIFVRPRVLEESKQAA